MRLYILLASIAISWLGFTAVVHMAVRDARDKTRRLLGDVMREGKE